MKRFQLLGLMLVAIFAIGVVAASAASAVTFLLAEWLAAGAAITTAQATDQEGELELEDSKVLGQKVVILCSGFLDGTVSGNGTDEITKLLSLAGVDAGEPLVGPGVTCTNTANCGGTPKVWAKKLPWKTAAELMIDGTETFFVDLIINGEYESECTVLGTKVTDECTSPEVATELTNEAGGIVDVKFSDPFQELAGLTLGTCTVGGALSAAVTGLGSALLTSGTALTISSE
jgi:hypothetical protein